MSKYEGTIIFLRGVGSCGKTITIKMVAIKLLEMGGEAEEGGRGRRIFFTSKEELNKSLTNGKEITGVIQYKGIRIGINGDGDTPSQIERTSWLIRAKKCKIALGAINTGVNGVEKILNKIKQIIERVLFEPKVKAKDRSKIDEENSACAAKLMGIIEGYVKEYAPK